MARVYKNDNRVSVIKSIYKLFKNENTLIISALFTIISFVSCVIVYLYENQLFKAWNIPPEFITDINSGKYFYSIIISLLFYVCILAAGAIITRMLSHSMPSYIICKYLKTLNRKKYWLGVTKKSEQLKTLFKESKKLFGRIQRLIVFDCIKIIATAVAIVLPAETLLILVMMDDISITWLLFAFVLTMPTVIFSTIAAINNASALKEIVSIRHRVEEVKRNRAVTKKVYNELTDVLRETLNTIKIRQNGIIGEIFKKEDIGRVLKECIISTFIFAICLIIMAPMSMRKQKTFWIYEDDNNTYVVLQLNSTKAVLKEAQINGDNINIDLRSNRYIDLTNIKTTRFKAGTVEYQNN